MKRLSNFSYKSNRKLIEGLEDLLCVKLLIRLVLLKGYIDSGEEES